MVEKIVVYAAGHWSTEGKLEGKVDYWSWGLELDGIEIPAEEMLDLHSNQTRGFYNEIRQYLPKDYEGRMIPPVHVPDSVGWSLNIPLEDFKDKEVVLTILKKYFPKQSLS